MVSEKIPLSVVIMDELLRNISPLGGIEAVYPGKDGQERVVAVKINVENTEDQ